MSITRRQLLGRSGATGLGVVVSGSVGALFTANPAAGATGPKAGYGPLVSDPDGLLDLPRGFHYRVLSKQGEPLHSGGGVVPGSCDGMAAFRGRNGDTHLVRNHERRNQMEPRVVGPASHTYDNPRGPAGCTTMRVDRHGHVREEYVSLAGTFVNCAGGTTPWRTWLSCEETERPPTGGTKTHGWVFEVDPYDNARNADPTPLEGLGRFQHEALAVDPQTGIVYETEDAAPAAGVTERFGLFYRFTPTRPLGGHGSLRAGGHLEAMRVPGVRDLSDVQAPGTQFTNIAWIDVPDPSAASVPTREQFDDDKITYSQKLEGAWWGRGSAYFVSSFARAADGSEEEHDGQVWRYDPDANTLELVTVFSIDDSEATPDGPDNITVSPYGGLFVAEDGGGENGIFGVTAGGKTFPFARNRQPVDPTAPEPVFGEMAGVTFSPDGRTLYVNCFTPGTTFAIRGPWRRSQD